MAACALVERALTVGVGIPIGAEQGLEFGFILREVEHHVQVVERFPLGLELFVRNGQVCAVIGILDGEGLGCVVVAGQQQVMSGPQIVGGTEGIVGVEAGDTFHDDRIARGQQFLERGQVACHAVLHVQPARIVANVIGHLFRVDVAVLQHGLDLGGDVCLVAFPAVQVQGHRERGRAAVVGSLLFVRWAGKRDLCGQRRAGGSWEDASVVRCQVAEVGCERWCHRFWGDRKSRWHRAGWINDIFYVKGIFLEAPGNGRFHGRDL